MRVLLIDIVRTTLEDVWPSVEHSLGLMYLAANLNAAYPGQDDIWIRTLISKPGHVTHERNVVRGWLDETTPDLVGVRCLSIGKDTLQVVAETVKEWRPDCFLVVGGPHATDDPGQVLSGGLVDCVVISEGETTFNELVSRLRKGQPFQDIAGIAYSQNATIVKTASRELINDLNALAFPDYSLVDLDVFTNQYLTFTSKIYQRHANIMTTRGCPYRCAYCHNILGKRFRVRSPENILKEIRFLHDTYGITDFQVIDDIFNLDLKRAKAICDLIIRSGMELTLSFPNGVRGDRMDEELIDKMAEAGTRFISYAIETASPRLQRLIRKNLKLDRIFDAIDYTAKVGIITRGFFMIGFPSETEEEVNETIEFAKASALCGATFFTVVYFPGTDLYRLAQSLGYFTDTAYEVQRDYVQVGEGPYAFNLETLRHLKKRAIREFAFTKERIENARQILPRYFTQREIDGFFMAYVVSSQIAEHEIEDETVRRLLHRYFLIADRFSNRMAFYV